jgi:hypothetical protein
MEFVDKRQQAFWKMGEEVGGWDETVENGTEWAESGTEWYENGTKWCKNGMGWDDLSVHIDDSEGCKVGVFEGFIEWINVLRCLPISG